MILNRFLKRLHLRLPNRTAWRRSNPDHRDTLTPVSLLGRFYEGRGPIFLLESVEGGERWARYSFLGFSAHLMVRVFADRVEIEEAGTLRSIAHGGNPFQVLREFLAPYRPADVFGLPRFWGGLVGHLNYEMVSFIEASRTAGRRTSRWPASWPPRRF
jgi:anthranilate synthase component 1